MKITEDKIVDTLLLVIKGAFPYEKSLMITGFIDCYECLHNLFPEVGDFSLLAQVKETFIIMAIRQNNKELMLLSDSLAETFTSGLDDVNGLEWALDVIKHNRT